MRTGARLAGEGTAAYEAGLAGVDEGLGREPLPHERARGAVVDGVDEAADVVVDCAGPRLATARADSTPRGTNL